MFTGIIETLGELVAMRQEAWLRIAWMLGILVCSALLYFGVLWATGLRLKAFLQR